MGKSPGKWSKAKFFGKKSTNSAMTKRGEAGKEEASSGVVTGSDPVISNSVPVVIERNGHNLASGNQTIVKPPEESNSLLSGTQDGSVKSAGLTSICNSDILKQEKAAAKVQAALRGYLARRAFWALKGIIRLQALIRGHLVRRQAVATLHCIQGIVRFQALVRGQKVRLSATGIEVKEKCNLEKLKLDAIRDLQSNRLVKLSRNDFAQKLLASSLNVMPLGVHYDSGDANSAWNWLERWSSSHFWELIVELKRDTGSKSSRKSGSNIGVELESGKPKRSIRQNSSTKEGVEEEEQVGRRRYEMRKRKKKDVAVEAGGQRIWGAEDELKILTGILEYKRETGLDFNSNLKAFYEFIRGSLNAVVDKDQFKNKIKNLKDKYHSNALKEANGKALVFSGHEAEAYEHSQKIWGGKSVSRESQGAKSKPKDQTEESVVPSDWILLQEKCLSQGNQIRILQEQLEAAEKKLQMSGMTEMELRTESLEQKKRINELRNKLGEAENKIIEGE